MHVLDGLLSEAAAAAPRRIAIRVGEDTMTFAELDTAVTRCASELRRAVGPGAAVGAVASLSPVFAVIYYAIARSGNVVVPINPLAPEPVLRQMAGAAGVRLVLADRAAATRLTGLAGELALAVVDAHGRTDAIPADAGRRGPRRHRDRELPEDVACIQFTSGTTGRPKPVMLTHANLRANARQVVAAHRLDERARTLNHLPLYHPMHLNAGVRARATQILCPHPDAAVAIETANRYGATRYYDLPVRFVGLAAHPRLEELRLTTVRGIYSGGAALSPAVAGALTEHFGVPALQGYGLAETSPMTHCDLLERPKIGSSGPAVADTECRIVGIESREPLACGEWGEVLVRGPQVMKGYLAEPQTPAVDADGWLATGDVGYLDEDGYLFLVDRIKDVFKVDNWLVAPAEIEELLAAHAEIRECVVYDHPDRTHGAVPHALVVLETPDADLARIKDQVNERLPAFKRLHRIEAVDRIPRSANGKVSRRQIRTEARTARAGG